MSNTITVPVGRSFEIPLYTHAGTGYSWTLSNLWGGVALMDVTTAVVTALPGGSIRQIFTFVGTASGKGELAFELIRPWEPEVPADKRSYAIEVVGEAEDAMRGAAGQEHFPPIATAACSGEHEGKTIIESQASCLVKYGYPTSEGNCVLKYGFPVTPLYNVSPPNNNSGPIIARYMAQPPRE